MIFFFGKPYYAKKYLLIKKKKNSRFTRHRLSYRLSYLLSCYYQITNSYNFSELPSKIFVNQMSSDARADGGDGDGGNEGDDYDEDDEDNEHGNHRGI